MDIDKLIAHVGCGDLDNMAGCPHCAAIREILRQVDVNKHGRVFTDDELKRAGQDWTNDHPFSGYYPCGCIAVQDEQKRCDAHRGLMPKDF